MNVPLSATALATLTHLPSLARRFARMGLRVEVVRTYRPRTGEVTLTFRCDPQSDTLQRDEYRVWVEAKQLLIDAGFYVWTVTTRGAPALRLTGYYGTVPATQVAA